MSRRRHEDFPVAAAVGATSNEIVADCVLDLVLSRAPDDADEALGPIEGMDVEEQGAHAVVAAECGQQLDYDTHLSPKTQHTGGDLLTMG